LVMARACWTTVPGTGFHDVDVGGASAAKET
jgi:hypothetical protein